MNVVRRTARGVPLVVLVGTGVLGGCAASVAAVALYLYADGDLMGGVRVALLVGFLVAVLVAAGFAVAAARLSTRLRQLRLDAVRRMQEPAEAAAPGGADRLPGRFGTELAELARTLDALQLRVRVADEVAQRHQRSAETASAGMFELLSGLVAAEEGARGQLSAELHDTAAQTLMTARSMLSDPALAAPDLARAADLVAEAEEQVRAVMARTRPPALRDGDLAKAVALLRDDLEVRYGLRVHLVWPDRAYPLPLATAVTVYRFFQEALLNVVKHADVDDATARLEVDESNVVAAVADDGAGFDPDEVTPERGRHVGLGLLRERARLAGGRLEVASQPGHGATLTLRLPRTPVHPVVPLPRATADAAPVANPTLH